ncbi:MAG: lipase family protein [Oscillospiraceae bacterium]|jgi:hypothetical protein|nr:lipase family protein [Oscillospiraceae bacterium]
MKKRVISVLLALTMVFAALAAMTLPASAAGAAGTFSPATAEIAMQGANIKWGAELFAQPSNVYNKDLALVSMVLSKIAHHDTEQSLNILGFENQLQIYNDTDELPPFIIAHQEWTVNGVETALILVAMQDSGASAAEWLNNLNIAIVPFYGYSVHAGFKAYADRVWAALNEFLAEHPNLPAKKKLLITGHSSGGACANLLTVRLDSDAGQKIADKNDIYAYGFATPNLYTSKAASDGAFDNIFNTVNTADIVPKLPANPLDPNGLLFPQWRKFGRTLTFTLTSFNGETDPHNLKIYIQGTPNASFAAEAPKFTFPALFEWLINFLRSKITFGG